MIFGNSVLNSKNAPAIWEDTLAKRPAPALYGRLFVRTDNPYGIYQDTGSSWVLVSGSGGGGSQNWDQVLNNGGALSQNRSFNFDYDFGLTFQNGDYFKLDGFNQFRIDYRNGVFPYDNYVIFDKNYLKYYTSTNVNTVFSFDYITGNVALGDFSGVFSSTHMNISVSSNQIYLAPQSVMTFLTTADSVYIGDANSTNTLTRLTINRASQNIITEFAGNSQGIRLQNRLSSIGDFDAVYYNHYIDVSNNVDDPYIRSYADNANPTTWCGFNIVGYDAQFGNQFMNLSFVGGLDLIRSYSIVYGDYIGFMLDFSSNQYYLGDFNNLANGGSLQIDGGNREANFDIDKFAINGAVLSTTSGSTSGQHLNIYINGTHYKIQLRNP